MTTVVTRIPKGSPLTWLEEDTNFNNLNNYKLESVAVSTTASRITKSGSPITTSDGTGGTIALDLATTAVTPGSYTSTDLTVDAYGRITAASNGSGASTEDQFTDELLGDFRSWSFEGGNGAVLALNGICKGANAIVGHSSITGHKQPIHNGATAAERRGGIVWAPATAPGHGLAWQSASAGHKIPTGTMTGGFLMLLEWYPSDPIVTLPQMAIGIAHNSVADVTADPIEDQGSGGATEDSFLICFPSGGGNIRVARRVGGTTTLTDTGVPMPVNRYQAHRWMVYCNPANGHFTASITELTDSTNAWDNVLYSNTFTSGNPTASFGSCYFPVIGGPETVGDSAITWMRAAGWYKV